VTVAAPFAWVGEHLVIDLPGGRALFSTRRGGVSEGACTSLNLGRWTDDDPGAIARNYKRLAGAVGLRVDALAQARQVHGTRVLHREAGGVAEEEADGVAVTAPGLAALVLTADCLPVALVAPGAVAMVHAGWRGLDGGVLEAGVAALAGAGPIRAAIGPGAGRCCYEVGPELHERFGTVGPTLDLKGMARERLLAAGVEEVHDAGLCTICTERDGMPVFFSHRRDAGRTGRQAGVVWRS
jgi:YfiH family protein